MFQRFHQMKEEREGGFTLIELLVVILIIAILAAIAIPVFLRQREKGWRSQLESALKNSATAQESYLTANDAYATDIGVLLDGGPEDTDATADEGLKAAAGVENWTITTDTGVAFCVQASHADLDATFTMAVSSEVSEPTEGTCIADGVLDPT